MSDTNNAIEDLCVLRSDDGSAWMVSVCHGQGRRERLASFERREEAAEFALAERDRRRAESDREPTVHFPDDCPCYQSAVTPVARVSTAPSAAPCTNRDPA